MSNDDLLYNVYQAINHSSERLDNIEKSVYMLLTQNMIDEYKKITLACKKRNLVHIFFNCDENKSPYSMNILYNNIAYEDSEEGRELLLDRIIKENIACKIRIQKEEIMKVKNIILSGKPSEASQYIKYGCIVSVNICQG